LRPEFDEFADCPSRTYKVRGTAAANLFMAAGGLVCYDSPSESVKNEPTWPRKVVECYLSVLRELVNSLFYNHLDRISVFQDGGTDSFGSNT
jgi:hypothetical protein